MSFLGRVLVSDIYSAHHKELLTDDQFSRNVSWATILLMNISLRWVELRVVSGRCLCSVQNEADTIYPIALSIALTDSRPIQPIRRGQQDVNAPSRCAHDRDYAISNQSNVATVLTLKYIL